MKNPERKMTSANYATIIIVAIIAVIDTNLDMLRSFRSEYVCVRAANFRLITI
ncbi:MAG: hypothetical protein ACREBS_04850 [Nitrososphaerales archaeon]